MEINTIRKEFRKFQKIAEIVHGILWAALLYGISTALGIENIIIQIIIALVGFMVGAGLISGAVKHIKDVNAPA